jgi:hypothetical protein
LEEDLSRRRRGAEDTKKKKELRIYDEYNKGEP